MRVLPIFLSVLLSYQSIGQNLHEHINPFIGTGGHGHTFPGPTLPFGMMQLSPDTRLDGWDGCSGYHFTDQKLYGFSHTHLSGTGVADYCDGLIMPFTEKDPKLVLKPKQYQWATEFEKKTEKASANYYECYIPKYKIKAALTTTKRCGMHKYTFDGSASPYIMLDMEHRDKVLEAGIKKLDNKRVEAFRISKAWAEKQHFYMVMEFSTPFTTQYQDGNISVFSFPGGIKEVKVRVGMSLVSCENAWKNLGEEITRPFDWNFDHILKAGVNQWEGMLSKVRVKGGTQQQQKIFYTALYHTMIHPNIANDVNGENRDFKGGVSQLPEGLNHYTVFSLWDTYRATHPLYNIILPDYNVEFMESMLRQFEQTGKLPIWELAGNETNCMIGYHAVSVFADAMAKRNMPYNPAKAMKAMVGMANNDDFGKAHYRQIGFVPGELESESVSKTLEYAYNDFCIAEAARLLDKDSKEKKYQSIYDEFAKRSNYWKNLLDPSSGGFFRAKMGHRFFSPFVANEVNFHYTEANAWQYAFAAPHHFNEMTRLRGGTSAMETMLDEMFSATAATSGREQADITGLIGQYAHGNEPSHHIAYLYALLGKPWKSQQLVRQICDEFYKNEPDGLIGNEDCGQMSAWYVFSAMGFYPVVPASDWYVAGEPLFDEIELFSTPSRPIVITKEKKVAGLESHYLAEGSIILKHHTLQEEWYLKFKPQNHDPKSDKARYVAPDNPTQMANFLPMPFIKKGESAFKESTQVELAFPYKIEGQEIWFKWNNGEIKKYNTPFTISENGNLSVFTRTSEQQEKMVFETQFKKIPKERKILSLTPYANQYNGGREEALIDMLMGGTDFRTSGWQGWQGTDVEVLIDLGKTERIESLALNCLQDQKSWIFMPSEVWFSFSEDGKTYYEIGSRKNTTDPKQEGGIIQKFEVFTKPVSARFIKVVAANPGNVPAWHIGAGGKSWIFADEVLLD